jgi:cytochrome P450
LRATTTRPGARIAPGPAAPGMFGHLAESQRDPLGFFASVQARHGDVARLRFGPYLAHLVTHPDGVRQVLADPHRRYTKQTPGFSSLRTVLGNGLLTSEGEFWRRQRRTAAPAFHRERIAGFAARMTAAAEDVAARWTAAARADATIDVAADMTGVTLRIVAETLLGGDVRVDTRAVAAAVAVVVAETNRRAATWPQLPERVPTPANRRFRAAIATLDGVVGGIIRARRAAPSLHGGGAADLLAMLMEARDEETGEGMSDRQLRDEALTIFVAGHETTANAMSWAFYQLSRTPAIERRLRAELAAVLGGRTPTMDDLPRLPYVRMVIQEVLRLYPPAWTIGRAVAADDEVCGYVLPAGSLALVSPYVTHRHPAVWDNPEGFDPERFDPRHGEPSRYAYFPFGAGPRICIGNTFALMEMQLLLATLAQRCTLTLVPGERVELEPSVTLRPRGGIRMRPHAHGPGPAVHAAARGAP